MILGDKFFEAKTFDLLVLVNCVHDDFGIDNLQVLLIFRGLLVTC